MYFSSDDIHAARTHAVDWCHQLSRSYLDSLEKYLGLSADFAKNLMQDGSHHFSNSHDESSATAWMEQSQQWQQKLLQQHLPALMSGVVHTSAAHLEQIWGNAESRSAEAKDLTSHFFDRGLKNSPWEIFWVLRNAKSSVDESFAVADQISKAAITATDLIDEEVKVQLSAPVSKKRKTSPIKA